jgi:hypothetical protein
MGKPIAPARGIAFAFPDVCQTPTPGGPIPIPYPNIAMLADASPVSNTANPLLVGPAGDPVVLKDSVVATSTGDEPGSASPTKGPCSMTQASASVVYGSSSSGIVRFMDTTSQNNGNANGFVLSAFPTVLVGD